MPVFVLAVIAVSLLVGYLVGQRDKSYHKFKVFVTDHSILFRVLFAGILILALSGIGLILHQKYSKFDTVEFAKFITGGLVVIGLVYSILAFEFNVKKTKLDYKTAKEILTFNTANDWHKSPIKDYQNTSIGFEKKFIDSANTRTVEELYDYVENNLEYRESLKGILNYFENLSIGVYKGLIDKQFVYEFISYIFEIYYVDYFYFIETHRVKRKNATIWVNYTNLAEEWWPSLKEEILNGGKKSSLLT